MKKLLTTGIIAGAAAVVFSASAAGAGLTGIPEGAITDVTVERSPSSLVVHMTIHPDVFPKKANREVWLRPTVDDGSHSLMLDSVLVAGRTRYYQHLRGNGKTGSAPLLRSGAKEAYVYTAVVPYEQWMEYSELNVTGRIVGCAGCTKGAPITTLYGGPLLTMDYRQKTLEPVMVYVSPVREAVKVRDVSNESYIDFPVGKTEIYPDYRRNPVELAEIRKTIEEIRGDSDITITAVDFTGYASPEGSYALNERLAEGRTKALMDYVNRYFDFPRKTLHYSWVAEDWTGLEKKVRAMEGLANKDRLLQLITDNSITPDEKDQRMKKEFPNDYAILLSQVYPSLRHTDYRVEYTVRSFTDLNEIAVLIRTAPQKLSLDEIYTYARTLDRGGAEFQDVMDLAVMMYPDDPVANLNAAATAAGKGNLDKARTYLSKAAYTPEATYTQAVIYVKEGDFAAAIPLLKEAAQEGIREASDLLQRIEDLGLF